IVGCRIHDNAGWGIHSYNGHSHPVHHDNLFVGNEVYRNGLKGHRGAGIGMYVGTGQMAYNNVIWGNYDGLELAYGLNGAGVFNNTLTGNLDDGIDLFASAN